MANNVQCAGQWIDVTDDGRDDRLYLAPCGWKGERFPSVPMTTMPRIAKADLERKATAKPCPRCGGTVALIDPTQEVER